MGSGGTQTLWPPGELGGNAALLSDIADSVSFKVDQVRLNRVSG